MEPVLADENFNEHVLNQLFARLPELDLVLAGSLGLRSRPDAQILEAAAELGRVLLTHDVNTVIADAYDRMRDGLPMPGVVVVPWLLPIGIVVNDLEVALGCGRSDDFEGKVTWIPL